MRIKVNYGDGRFIAKPDPANVPLFERVEWEFYSNWTGLPDIVTWQVYFDEQTSPVRGVYPLFLDITSTRTSSGEHRGFVGPIVATERGDHKYGVRAINTNTGAIIGDDDPHLLVS